MSAFFEIAALFNELVSNSDAQSLAQLASDGITDASNVEDRITVGMDIRRTQTCRDGWIRRLQAGVTPSYNSQVEIFLRGWFQEA